MINEKRIINAFENAKDIYESYGVDVDKTIEKFNKIPVSIPCWTL